MWIIFVVGVILLSLVVYWSLKPSNDGFNDANKLHMNLRSLDPRSTEYATTVAEVIRLCQDAIREGGRNGNGDAAVMLASYYMIAADTYSDTAILDFCLPKAYAVISMWKSLPAYTKNRRNGDQTYEGIIGYVERSLAPPISVSERTQHVLLKIRAGDWSDEYVSAMSPNTGSELLGLLELESLLNEGSMLLDLNRYGAAIVPFSKVLDLVPNHERALLGRAVAELHTGWYGEALKDISRAIELNPHPMSIATRGKIYYQLEDYSGSLADYNWAISLDPSEPHFYKQRGIVSVQLDRKDHAISDLTKYLQMLPPEMQNSEERMKTQQMIEMLDPGFLERLTPLLISVKKLKDSGEIDEDAFSKMVEMSLMLAMNPQDRDFGS